MAIYLPKELGVPKTIEDVFNFLFSVPLYNTLSSVKTYHDIDCNEIQSIGNYRSFTDILEICETYNIETSLQELVNYAFKSDTLFVMYCANIHKIVLYKLINKIYTIAYYAYSEHSFINFNVDCDDDFTIKDFLRTVEPSLIVNEIIKFNENNPNLFSSEHIICNNILLFLEEEGRYNKTS